MTNPLLADPHRATIRQAAVWVGTGAAGAPDPLLTVGDRPFLAWVMRELCRYGVERVLLLAAGPAGPLHAALPALLAALPRPLDATIVSGPAHAAREHLDARLLLLDGHRLLDANWAALLADAARDADAVPARALRHASGADTGLAVVSRALLARATDDPFQGLADQDGLPATVRDGELVDIATPAGLARARHVVPTRFGRRPALFLDRDGVLNLDHGYVGHRDRFEWTSTARQAVRAACEHGWHVFLATNQSGVARGMYDEAAVLALYDFLRGELHAAGATIDDWRYCPTHPEGSVAAYAREDSWRKPGPGMLLDLLRAWRLDPADCVMVGDQSTDVQAAAAAGIAGHLFPGGDLRAFLAPLLERAPVRAA